MNLFSKFQYIIPAMLILAGCNGIVLPTPPSEPEPEPAPVEEPSPKVDSTFINYLISQFDIDGDGTLSTPEKRSIRYIESHSDNFTDVSILKELPALEYLHLEGGRPTDGHPSGYGQISEIDLTGNPELWHLVLTYNNLTKLDLSKNSKLVDAYIQFQPIGELILPENGNLQMLYASGCKFKSLDVSMFPNMTACTVEGNPYMEKLYLSRKQNFRQLTVDKWTEIIYVD